MRTSGYNFGLWKGLMPKLLFQQSSQWSLLTDEALLLSDRALGLVPPLHFAPDHVHTQS
jgi:hypothetical protein